MRQLTLDKFYSTEPSEAVEERVVYNKIHAKQATFRSGLSARVHRWFRLTPSFGPDLVREILTTLECGPFDVVLDPFAGASTTLIECQLNRIKSYGFEINPFLQFVGQTCLNWDLNTKELDQTLKGIRSEFRLRKPHLRFEGLEAAGLPIPKIHNPTRWWRPDVLVDLVNLKRAIADCALSNDVEDFFRLALAAVLIPDLSNVTLGRLQLHFIDRSNDTIDALERFSIHATGMIRDLDQMSEAKFSQTSRVFLQNSTNLQGFNLLDKIDCVVTSPPYPNRYSYVWNTRPHLYMLDFLSDAGGATAIDKETIGGTWGTATSMLAKGVIEAHSPAVNSVVGNVVGDIRKVDNLMANYAMKYFNLLAEQILAMDKVLSPDARIAYVVGCSRLKGVYIETDVLLGRLFERLDLSYKVAAVERIRKRNSGKDLHESIVYAWKH